MSESKEETVRGSASLRPGKGFDRTRRLLSQQPDIKIQIGDIQINVLNVNYEPPVPMRYFPLHCHSSCELHFIPYGRGKLTANGHTFPIEPGTFYLTGPGVYHEQLSDALDPMCEYAFEFEFHFADKLPSRYFCPPSGELEGLRSALINTRFWLGRDTYETWRLAAAMLDELEIKLIGYYTLLQNLSSQLIIEVLRKFAHEKTADYGMPEKIPADLRRKLTDNFFRSYDRPLTPEALAKTLGVSVRHLDRILKGYYGMSFKEKLLSTRIEIVKGFLDSPGATLEDIAARTGFSSPGYLSRQFKALTGKSPSAYRRSLSTPAP